MQANKSIQVSAFPTRSVWKVVGLTGALFAAACGGEEKGSASDALDTPDQSLHALIGAEGGELVGAAGSAFAGITLTIPPGALHEDTKIEITPADSATPLPKTAVRCGPEFAIAPAGLKLDVPATLTLPFDQAAVADQFRFDDEVKMWVLDGDSWGRREQLDNEDGKVSISLDTLTSAAAGVNPPADQDIVRFSFTPANAKFLPCLAQYPDDAKRQPSVDAYIVRGDENDGLFLRGKNFKPDLQFDLFSIENSPLTADGVADTGFKGFGLAWYQSDMHANGNGGIHTTIRTILLDQIFGFDPTVALSPTNTFHMGFWFNAPEDAAACGFDVTKPTPFNGEHKAGPLAMVTVPEADTTLGPLCTKADTSVSPARCDP